MRRERSNRQNIRVAVRCRPFNSREENLGDFSIVESCKDQQIVLKDKSTSLRSYTFDRVFGPHSKQKDIYNDMVAPTVVEVLEGYNCTIFAYGQTGTGKTYTMTGERSDSLRYTWETDPTAGIVPRALNQIFSTLEAMGCDFSVRVSFLELYNEELFDLLSSGEGTVRLAIYDDSNKKGSILVKGLREVAVHNKDEVYGILEKGLIRRQTANTQLNAQSSRSHTVFTVTVHIKETFPEEDEVFLKIGKLNLVDLAGSENIGRSGALDKRAREAGSINQSLLTLGRVITCLVDHSPHIPYRESKLTRLLQDSLGGKTKTSIIATIGPGFSSFEETVSTLDYAHRAKNIQNRPEINQRLNKTQLIKGYNEELERLRRDLEATRSKTGVFIDSDNYAAMTLQLKQQRIRIDDLESRREVLEADLDAAFKNFELTQQELSEIKDVKEEIESELNKANEELKSTMEMLEETQRRLKEEKYLRSEYQITEERLAEQTRNLISVASTFEADIEGLHGKIDRFKSLELKNRSAIRQLPEGFLAENLKEPLEVVCSLEKDISTEIEQLSNQLGDACKQLQASNEANLREVDQLSSVLASIVVSNLKTCVDGVENLVNTQVETVTQFRVNTMDSALDVVNKLGSELQENLASMRQRLLNENKTLCKIFDDLTTKTIKLSKTAEAWASFRNEAIEENNKLRVELKDRGELRESKANALVESLEEALKHAKSLIKTDVDSDMKMDEALTAQYSHIRQFVDGEEKTVTSVTNELLTLISSANDEQKASVSTTINDLGNCVVNLDTLSKSVKDAGDTLNVLADRTSQTANECMHSSHGLGKQLKDHCAQWESINSDSIISDEITSISSFAQTVEGVKEHFTKMQSVVESAMGRVGDAVASVEARIPAFKEIRSALVPRLPVLLSNHLSETIRDYSPTGETPSRKNLPYPKSVPRTERHSVLLTQFREDCGTLPLVDVSNVPSAERRKGGRSPILLESEEENSAFSCGSRTSSGVGTISPKSMPLQSLVEDLPKGVKSAPRKGDTKLMLGSPVDKGGKKI
nr:kinesin family 1 [Hymenolepis microstoma]